MVGSLEEDSLYIYIYIYIYKHAKIYIYIYIYKRKRNHAKNYFHVILGDQI
jgi:hypothetical protein